MVKLKQFIRYNFRLYVDCQRPFASTEVIPFSIKRHLLAADFYWNRYCDFVYYPEFQILDPLLFKEVYEAIMM